VLAAQHSVESFAESEAENNPNTETDSKQPDSEMNEN
jgi:hypothetical protein